MLYDVIPPLLLFTSLGGIVVVVSRVVMRMKRQELSHAIQAEGARVTRPAHKLLNPVDSQISLMKNRLVVIATSAAKSAASLKNIPAQIKDARARGKQAAREVPAPHRASAASSGAGGVQPPQTSWRDRLSSAYESTTKNVGNLKQTIQARLTQPPLPPAMTTSTIKLHKVDVSPKIKPTPRIETTAEKIQSLVTRRSKVSPLKQAQAALAQRNFSRAENILVPYIVKHPKNTDAYMLLGEAAIGRQAWEEATEIFAQVLSIDPQAGDAYAQLGLSHIQAGHFTRALEALQRAHDADSDNVVVLKNLLTIAQRMDNKVLQKSVLQKLLVLEPGNTEIHSAAETLEAKEQAAAPE